MTTLSVTIMAARKSIISSLIFFILLFLSACGPSGQDAQPERYICLNDNREEKICDADEMTMIDGVNGIIAALKSFKKEDLDENFYQRAEGDDDLYVFGENHSNADVQKETLAAINFLARSGGKIRLEGRDRSSPEFKGKSCALALLGMVQLSASYDKLGRGYDPKERADWVKKTGFWKRMVNTSPSYELSELNLSKLTCGYWDDKPGLKGSNINRYTLTIRNQAMVATIKNDLPMPAGQKLIILSGISHLPFGEFLLAQRKNSHIPGFAGNIDGYFLMVEAQLRLAPAARTYVLRQDSAGTTKDIFDYLKIQGNFREMVPKSLIK